MRTAFFAAAAVVALSMPALAAGPDLVPDFDTATGTVMVKNVGDGPASISVVTINCKRRKPPVTGGGGGCPEIPPAFVPNYTNPMFPNVLAVNVGPLAPGATFNHVLPFFGALVFPPGAYAFTVKADAGNSVPETNEANNVKVRTKVVP
ncbi:MAG: hypothetical protein KBA31_18035 [Alphaproteobacteria bacterium]|nr:hypothetical protein [Alphaproteobacteria bacterium]